MSDEKPKLPPLPDEAFDGERSSIDIKLVKCPHKNVSIKDNIIRCTCGAAWGGPNIERLYQAFKKQSS